MNYEFPNNEIPDLNSLPPPDQNQLRLGYLTLSFKALPALKTGTFLALMEIF